MNVGASTTQAQTQPDIAPATTPDIWEREMRVVIRPYAMDVWEYRGSRAHLEAEGVIPAKTEWPEGCAILHWEDDRFRWVLGRVRPQGLKGPKKLWASGDWWSLYCHQLNGPDPATRRLLHRKRELAEEIYRQSVAGQRERRAKLNRYFATFEDKAFQAFKANIPGLIPAKRGRRPKVATQGAQL